METQPTPATATETASPEARATYCPEDNKLRLYVGWLPRPEFDALRAEGWKALYKQREAGGGDFVAIWTPVRRDTALAFAGVIEDEDMGPAERAADRAERFAGYREKRTAEAVGQADRFEAGPAAHGFQSLPRAERAAARHDLLAARAVDAWGKAEYWQQRTAGVINHALHVASPSVRMGRIKELESEIRKAEKRRSEYVESRQRWIVCAAMTDAAAQTKRAALLAGAESGCYNYKHPRPEQVKNAHIRTAGASLWTLLEMDHGEYGEPITGAEACALYLATHRELGGEGDWLTHYRLRLAYEEQMMEAQGGRAGVVEMIPGGWLRGGRHLTNEERQIEKVNRSHVTRRIVSVLVRDNRPSSRNHYGNPFPDGVARVLCHTVEIERASPGCYRAPSVEELAAFEARKQAEKDAAPKKDPCPLLNPTDADADRLQALWNERAKAEHARRVGPCGKVFEPSTVLRISQAVYSANSKGSYASAETRDLHANAELADRSSSLWSRAAEERKKRLGAALCKIRQTSSGDYYGAPRVIILTDKPQKSLPAAVWQPFTPATAAADSSGGAAVLAGRSDGLTYTVNA